MNLNDMDIFEIIDTISMLMRENDISFEEAVGLFEDAHQGEYTEENLRKAISQINNKLLEGRDKQEKDTTPEAAAAWIVSDKEAQENYIRNTKNIGPETDYKQDPVEEMGKDNRDDY